MTINPLVQEFLRASQSWICAEYYCDFRYIARRGATHYELLDSSLHLNPLPPPNNAFRIDVEGFGIGQVQILSRHEPLLKLINEAIAGSFTLEERSFVLPSEGSLGTYSDMVLRERWFSDLHLRLHGSQPLSVPDTDLARVDNGLRLAEPPFDGLADVAGWLGLRQVSGSMLPTLDIRIGPPVDLIFARCSLADNKLSLTFLAHALFDTSSVNLSVRIVPGPAGLAARRTMAGAIVWGEAKDGLREGKLEASVEEADSVLVMLMIGTSTVRRQWFADSQKARNQRLAATLHFDKDLKMVRRALLEATDSATFERGAASILFLLGFNPAIQLETDAPDLIVATPAGRLAVVECTTRIADFQTKLGKLVDRRVSLEKHLTATRHIGFPPVAALICRLPKDQIAAHVDDVRSHKVILITGEDIEASLNQVRFPDNPDKMLADKLAELESSQQDDTDTK